jgi:hypothetical protein
MYFRGIFGLCLPLYRKSLVLPGLLTADFVALEDRLLNDSLST